MKPNSTPLDAARLKMGLNVDEVARLAGVSYWQALRTLRGESGKPKVIKKLCDALKVDPSLVYGN